jgi:3D (Asp-Asp-Asp) domain-containing protein
VLLLFSVISYGEGTIQQQEPKLANNISPASSKEVARPEVPANESAADTTRTFHDEGKQTVVEEKIVVPPRVFTATAYSLPGRTASGKPVSRGLIAADPALLPLGTRVRVEAGSFTGDYVVADTGGAVRGRRIDIWTPTAREAMKFGRRAVKLTVLSFGDTHHKLSQRQLKKDNTASPSPVK